MNFDTTILLAFIQSATEFLPVSSSGHLILMEKFGFSQQPLLMDISLHLGTLFAVLLFFRKDVFELIKSLFIKTSYRKLAFQLILATIPVCLAGFFLQDIIENALRSPFVIAFTSIFYGILLWFIDKKASQKKDITQLSYKEAFLIGCAQTLALIPGTSRSGITITCARLLGFKRAECARFSMLLSIPSISLAALYMILKGFLTHTLSQGLALEIGVGIIASALFGLLAVWFLMKWVQKANFALFAVYRIILGIFLFWFFI